jgi:hypothetical protein
MLEYVLKLEVQLGIGAAHTAHTLNSAQRLNRHLLLLNTPSSCCCYLMQRSCCGTIPLPAETSQSTIAFAVQLL